MNTDKSEDCWPAYKAWYGKVSKVYWPAYKGWRGQVSKEEAERQVKVRLTEEMDEILEDLDKQWKEMISYQSGPYESSH